MTASKELQDFINALEESAKGSISYHVTFDYETTLAMLKYTKDKKLGSKPQPLIRLAVTSLLKKSGYL